MNLPVVDVAAASPAEVLATLQLHGAALVVDPAVSAERCDRMLADAAAFFALGAASKAELAIEGSQQFRGYSRMHSERDFREQIHFGREVPPEVGCGESFWRLQGPNRWPADPAWREGLLEYMDAVEQVGHRLLAKLAAALGLDHRRWLGTDPYVLMKCIGYHPQVAGGGARRGVAAHLDFSLVTLTLQDDTGGLEFRAPEGEWRPVPWRRGAWFVNIGELLQFVTGDRLVATPHRVVNRSLQRLRCSVPLFVNPSLVTTLVRELPRTAGSDGRGREHVHAVLDGATEPPALHYGAAEWRRKGENVWCAACVPTGGVGG